MNTETLLIQPYLADLVDTLKLQKNPLAAPVLTHEEMLAVPANSTEVARQIITSVKSIPCMRKKDMVPFRIFIGGLHRSSERRLDVRSESGIAVERSQSAATMRLTAEKPSFIEVLAEPGCRTRFFRPELPRRGQRGESGRRHSDKLSTFHAPPNDTQSQPVVLIVGIETTIQENTAPFYSGGGPPIVRRSIVDLAGRVATGPSAECPETIQNCQENQAS